MPSKVLLLGLVANPSLAFLTQKSAFQGYSNILSPQRTVSSTLFVRPNEYSKRGNKNAVTVKDIIERVKKDADRMESVKNGAPNNGKRKNNRTRKRKEAPKQTYLYAAQRKALERKGVVFKKKNQDDTEDDDDNSDVDGDNNMPQKQINKDKNSPITIARKLGLNPQVQACDGSFNVVYEIDDETNLKVRRVDPAYQPRIVGEVKLGSDSSNEGASSMSAYIIDKPAGWSILEGKKKKKNKNENRPISTSGKDIKDTSSAPEKKGSSKNTFEKQKKKKNRQSAKYYNEESDDFGIIEFNESDLMAMMTPEELKDFEQDGGLDSLDLSNAGAIAAKAADDAVNEFDDDEEIDAFVTNARNDFSDEQADRTTAQKVHAESSDNSAASFEPESRPSIVSWLKDMKAAEGTPIRGGKFWAAIAGAVEVDDSGLLLLCPKEKIDDVFVDSAEYSIVIGNGKHLRPKGKRQQVVAKKQSASLDQAEIEEVAKLRKGRDDDVVVTTRVYIPDGASTSDDAVHLCQQKYMDGVRGDPNANPLDRRANRRLVHCSSLSVSSLSQDDFAESESDLPDDIKILSGRRNNHQYTLGSFLGRAELKSNEHTNAYREINGAADGFPGWTVDRYDKWLLVQHDDDYERGPLPSLHDGSTVGVYYFSTERDRSITGAKKGIKPILLEGQPAPDMVPIKENGIEYHINFDDLSTGIFLDQRSQRAWLARHCNSDTKVLNCFSHCGAFSIAAATAGAETVSLDLDKKWLDRVEPQLKANGINDDGRHDCIYGDCK